MIGFIGCGNMAGAIIDGLLQNSYSHSEICVYDPKFSDSAARHNFENLCGNESKVAEKSQIIILAVKPNKLKEVLKKIDPVLAKKQPLIISIAAGKTIDFISSSLENNAKIARVMPNINARVGEAMSAYCTNERVSEEEKREIEKILSCFGAFIALEESYFPVFGVIAGCAPAFSYLYIDSLARAGVQNGMKKEDALKIAAQTVYGSAKMILESPSHPWELIDQVCSPGGTTIEGITSLQTNGFEAAVNSAVSKAVQKDKKL